MSFNLSAWALQNRQIVLYLMILLGAVGALSYSKLGQSEDPPFTFKAMVVQTNWPGASAEEVARQVTERIEKKLMETGDYDRIVSFSRPGVSQVTFMAREDIHSSEIPELWYQIRKKISDIRATLPQSIQGPFFNDEFGTTYGNIYALTGKGFDYAVMKDYADRLQLQLQRIRNVGKVRADRPAGREDLDRPVQHQAGHPRPAPGGGTEGAGGTERGGLLRVLRDRQRPRAVARFRAFRFGGGDPRLPYPRRRPHLPHRRRGRGSPRLQRSAGAAHALHGRGRHRPGGSDEAGRRHPGAGQGPGNRDSPACSGRCRPDWNCARCPTSRRRYVPGSASSSGCWPRRW